MQHGGDIYRNTIEYDFSVSVNPFAYEMDEVSKRDIIQSITHYPDMECEKLRKALALRYGLIEKCIICANGASELFMAVCRALKPKNALLLAPTFSGYEYALKDCDIKKFYTKASADFVLEDTIIDAITDEIDILFLGSVENPTGHRLKNELLKDILDKAISCKTTVIVDDSFYELSYGCVRENIQDYINEYSNLIIVNSFTKTYGYPGIRIGFAFSSNQACLKLIQTELPEWNVSGGAQHFGQIVSADKSHLIKSHKAIMTEKLWLENELSDLGLKYIKADANFILLYCETNLYKELLKRKILIKAFDTKDALADYYRIAVRSREENKILIDNLRKILLHRL